jgi:hypothetical protein
MGKAATNERIKLNATFLNNIAVGLVITGILVPYLALVQWTFEARVLCSLISYMEISANLAN